MAPGSSTQLALTGQAPAPIPPPPVPTSLAQLRSAAAEATRQYEESFTDIRADMMPEIAIPEANILTAFGAMYDNLQGWQVAGMVEFFDWNAMAVTVGKDLDTVELAKTLVGPLLDKWYPSARPAPEAVVPRQLATLFLHSLGKIREEFMRKESVQAIQDQAAIGQIALQASCKRLRSE